MNTFDLRKIGSRAWASRSAFVDGAYSGLKIFLIFAASISLALLLLDMILRISSVDLGSLDGFGPAAAAVTALALSAGSFGLFPSLSSTDQTAATFTILGAVPLLAVIALVSVRSASQKFAQRHPEALFSKLLAFALGLGAALVLLPSLTSFAVQGFGAGGLVLAPFLFVDGVIAGSLITIVSAWSSSTQVRKMNPDGNVHLFDHLNASVKVFLKLWTLALAVATAVLVTYLLIKTNFGPAQESSTTTPSSGLEPFQLSQLPLVLAVVVTFALLLPLLVYYFLGFTLGGSFAIETTGTQAGFNLNDYLEPITQTIGLDIFGVLEVGVFSLVPGVSLAIGIIIAFLALVASVGASRASGYVLLLRRDGLTVLAFVAFVFVLLQRAFSFGVSYSASATAQPNQGAPSTVQAGQVIGGISDASIALIGLLLAGGLLLGSTWLRSALDEAMSPIVRLVTGKPRPDRTTTANGQAVGVALALIFTAAVAAPLSIVTVERVWASVDGPGVQADRLKSSYESGASLSSLVVSTATGVEWLNEEAILKARPTADFKEASATLNNLSKPWETGNTEALTTIRYEKGNRAFVLKIESSASLIQLGPITRPSFSSAIVPATLTLSAPRELRLIKDFSFKLNGVEAKLGSFSVLPGVYTVSAPRVGLVGELSHEIFVSSGTEVKFDFGQSLAIADSVLDEIESSIKSAQDACKSLDGLEASSCPSMAELNKVLSVKKGSPTNGGRAYLGLTSQELTRAGIETSDASVSFKVECTPVRTEVTVLAVNALPRGVDSNFDTAITRSTCKFTLSLVRTFKDRLETNTLDIEGSIERDFFSVGVVKGERFVPGKLQIAPSVGG